MNNSNRNFILAALLVLPALFMAQDKVLTIADISYMNRAIFPARVPQLQWVGSSDNYAYSKGNEMVVFSARKEKEVLLINLDMINTALHENGMDSLKGLPQADLSRDGVVLFSSKGKFFTYTLETKKLVQINEVPDTAENVDYHPGSENVAFTLGNNLYVSQQGKQTAITREENTGIVSGQIVSRNEFGIHKGIFWSPDGSKVAYYRKDESKVTTYPLVDISKRVAAVENTRYPMAGMASETVSVGIYDLAGGKTIFLKTGGPADQYLTSVTWGPDSKLIYVALLNREQNHLKLNQYDAATGELVKTLFEEKNEKYVEPENPLYFLPQQPEWFVWTSERDGYNHLYLYDTSGKMIRQLTQGNWVVTDLVGMYDGKNLFFTGTKESPLQQNIYSVDVNTSAITRVSQDHGTHDAAVSPDGKFVIDIYSSTDVSREYKLLDAKGKTLRVIQADTHPLKDYLLGEMSIFTIKGDDGTDLYCRLIKPVHFDSTKKYPVVIYVYGGPHDQEITDSWLGGARLPQVFYAEQGYLVFTLDNHGSANRGRDFEQVIHRNLGIQEVNDQMKGVEYLKSLPYVDSERIGVEGWSYGGFMTISLMLRQPETFRVGVAGGPVIDWKYYEVMYGERYMDTPDENPEGYANCSLLPLAENLNGKLLIIHGTMDPTVVWQNSLMFLQESINKGKFPDYFVYPGHGHGVGGNDRDHLNELIFTYFKENL